jgi:hypothetical protein
MRCSMGWKRPGRQTSDFRFGIAHYLILKPRAYFPNFLLYLFIDLVFDLAYFRKQCTYSCTHTYMGENDDQCECS